MGRSKACRITLFAFMILWGAVAQNRAVAISARASDNPTVTIVVKSSSRAESYSTMTVNSPRLAKAIARAEYEKTDGLSKKIAWPDVEVILQAASSPQSIVLRIEQSGTLFDESSSRRLILSKPYSERLRKYAEALRGAHYGELVRWEEAKSIVKRKSIITVTDLETGLSFRVQRRAGSDHADVQPISKEDSKIMKGIYGGQWSWDRRAIVVGSNGHRIAASMNGMPHGGDGIPGNDFSGHSCIHFQESTSHKSDVPDPAHQLMVNKAAGNLQPYLDSASPFVIAASFIEALHQRDIELLRQIWKDMPQETAAYYEGMMTTLTSIRIKADTLRKKPKEAGEQELSATVDVPITIYGKGKSGRGSTYRFAFNRESPEAPWRIAGISPPGPGLGHSSLIP
ncbi:hypothetical protein D7Z26_00685 [Cohnella endophytica]|uniref:Uncharacterized protein n=1 Tax=Cohnella endophytica TaxID=2419778 RepID=A0A494YDG3_9BACL|nr:hypothetical protein [Cohnella endophytica]RKP58055.1 hypothetical protein D7Z26_00685 [Cohnella endophytica]